MRAHVYAQFEGDAGRLVPGCPALILSRAQEI